MGFNSHGLRVKTLSHEESEIKVWRYAMAASFVGYVDESGDEGFKFTAGSSAWFVLSAVITRKTV